MKRRVFVVGMVAVLAAPLAGETQQAGKVARIGYLSDAQLGPLPAGLLEAFREGLRNRGWGEGRNLVIEVRHAETAEQRRAIAAEMQQLKVDAILATTASAFIIAPTGSAPIPGVPIIFVAVSDPVRAGMVASLARPGGRMTGLTYLGIELNPKRLQLLKEALPSLSRISVLVPAHHPLRARMVEEIEAVARPLNIALHLVEIATDDAPTRIDEAFSEIVRARTEAVLGLQGAGFFRERTRIAELCLRHRLPGIFEVTPYAEAGCLMTYSPSLVDLWRRAAEFVDKVLRGAKPADLPVEQPTKFELVINAKTARAVGLTVPPSLLLRADRVIE
jgi:ABC-type uncharacterized transport system substrate-binding protein